MKIVKISLDIRCSIPVVPNVDSDQVSSQSTLRKTRQHTQMSDTRAAVVKVYRQKESSPGYVVGSIRPPEPPERQWSLLFQVD